MEVPEGVPVKNAQSMQCPVCRHGRTAVLDKRNHSLNIKRRRERLGCGHRFTTQEFPCACEPQIQGHEVRFKIKS